MATKTSILLFYLTLSKGNKIFRYATYGTLFVVNAAGLALTFLNIFQCHPFSATFQTPIPDNATCQDIITLYLSSAPVNIITDLAILFLPMPILTAMRLPKKQKMILVITFGVGFFVAVVDVIRIVYLQDAALNSFQEGGNGQNQRNQTDVSWYASLSFMWSAVEVNIGIMCANVPGLKPLVSRFMPYILRDKGENSRSRAGYTHGSHGAEHVRSLSAAAPPGTNARDSVLMYGPNSTAGETVERRMDSGVARAEEPKEDDDIGMMDFLTTPDMAELPTALRREATAKASVSGPPDPTTFFDFVVMERKKSLVKMTNKESLFPIIVVTILFFMWGVAYGFLDTLNGQFQSAAHMTREQSIGIHSAYFGAYFLGSLTIGRWTLKKLGFKACYIIGLCIYASGTLVFWPSAVLKSFPAFLVSNFIVGLGLSLLEVAANPFVALCGPSRWMEARLNLSQGVQAVGTVFSPLLASKVLFKNAKAAQGLVDVQWTYLGIALFTTLLAVAIYYIPLPEATDDEFEEAAEHPDLLNFAEIKGIKLVKITLIIACIAQFCYVGAQEAISTAYPAYIREEFGIAGQLIKGVDPTGFLAIGHGAFAAGRFLCAFLNIFIKARLLLLFFFTGALVCSILVMRLTSNANEALILVLYFFEGPIFALIFGIALRGLGRFTKDGASLITASISGGAAFPPIMWAVAGKQDARLKMAYSVVVAAFAVSLVFPAYLNLFPLARNMADPVKPENPLPHHAERGAQSPTPPHDSRRSSIANGVAGEKMPESRRPSSMQQNDPDSGPDFLTTPEFLRS
jgi:fucose permease